MAYFPNSWTTYWAASITAHTRRVLQTNIHTNWKWLLSAFTIVQYSVWRMWTWIRTRQQWNGAKKQQPKKREREWKWRIECLCFHKTTANSKIDSRRLCDARLSTVNERIYMKICNENQIRKPKILEIIHNSFRFHIWRIFSNFLAIELRSIFCYFFGKIENHFVLHIYWKFALSSNLNVFHYLFSSLWNRRWLMNYACWSVLF